METNRATAPRQALLIVLVLAFCALMFELVISRMSVFYLNYANSFLAIPLTLFGLAVGSLRVHLGRAPVSEVSVGRNLIALTVTSFLAFAAVFFLFSQYFSISLRTVPTSEAALFKTICFVLLFLPPFFYIGKILTVLYATYREMIGKLYGFDLLGAALACFATPVLFHFVDLPYIILTCLLAMTAVTAVAVGAGRLKVAVPLLVVAGVLLPALIHLESSYDMSGTVQVKKTERLTELKHRWNEFSRVSLLQIRDRNAKRTWFRIIHDNAESNVGVRRYRPDQPPRQERASYMWLPFLLGRPTDDIMVMFAGCGKQMVALDSYGGGKNRLVGVEINPLVVDFAVQAKQLENYRLKEFLDKPNVELAIAEGRSYLDNDKTSYDLIYAGSNAATFKYKTGHSRKYLDTKEAMESYLAHLRPEGMLIFDCQPSFDKIEALKTIYRERGWTGFADHIIVMTVRNITDHCDLLAYSARPFTTEDVATVSENYRRKARMLYAPGGERNHPTVAQVVERPNTPPLLLVTDDRPFSRTLDFEHFEFFPSARLVGQVKYYRSWIKIWTMVGVCLLCLAFIGGLHLRRAHMPPLGMTAYLLITGFCYMLVEITFIGKLELFLENPLYSMALLLSIFLLTNAVGSMLYNRHRAKLNMTFAPLAVAAIVLVSSGIIGWMTAHRLGFPLSVKIVMAAAVISPVGVCLGLFYPFVVTWLNDRERSDAIPITYGISTLSSVAGATYTMTMIINFGYNSMILQAAIGYAILTVFMAIHTRLRSH